jgi:hypothetical protein
MSKARGHRPAHAVSLLAVLIVAVLASWASCLPGHAVARSLRPAATVAVEGQPTLAYAYDGATTRTTPVTNSSHATTSGEADGVRPRGGTFATGAAVLAAEAGVPPRLA